MKNAPYDAFQTMGACDGRSCMEVKGLLKCMFLSSAVTRLTPAATLELPLPQLSSYRILPHRNYSCIIPPCGLCCPPTNCEGIYKKMTSPHYPTESSMGSRSQACEYRTLRQPVGGCWCRWGCASLWRSTAASLRCLLPVVVWKTVVLCVVVDGVTGRYRHKECTITCIFEVCYTGR